MNFDEETFLVMAHYRAQEREKIDNPMGFDREKPFDALPLLSSIDISTLLSKQQLAHIDELKMMASHLKDMTPQKEILEKLWSEEFRYSNLIEGIEDSDGGLKNAWSLIENHPNYSIDQIEALSQEITPDKAGIRKLKKGCRVRIAGGGMIQYTPPKSRKVIVNQLNDLENIATNGKFNFFALIPLEHFQYESTHPLWDGNGRSGRLIMLKRLMEMLDTQIPLQLSLSIFETRALYYSALNAPRLKNDYNELIDYFLDVFESALIYTLNECE